MQFEAVNFQKSVKKASEIAKSRFSDAFFSMKAWEIR
jgi:hypothetical protein